MLALSGVYAFEAEVSRVVDGDTVDVSTAEMETLRVRMACIDAPERGGVFGEESMGALKEYLDGETVEIVEQDMDRFGRIVGTVKVQGADVNLDMVRSGFARVYPRYCTDDDYYIAEKGARLAGVGLWADVEPVLMVAGDASCKCGTKRYCGQMRSCAEAYCFTQKCGLTRLDGDKDGVPCESICR
ncbi:thermonuclease family protein [Limisalsivibrio acetivorans]|uniref:thermonuclease family protein n=1 Tax=Limisalsivibrio acetivorans TaxID=1304888 RepID=UPI00138AC9ED|nr:thermonuclease family protein [Limisalsivibrio acetivorans]